MTSEEEYLIIGLLRAELVRVNKRLAEGPNDSAHDSYLLGFADGIVISASHLGITLLPNEKQLT